MNLNRAIEIALEAYKSVLDKGDNPYILYHFSNKHIDLYVRYSV